MMTGVITCIEVLKILMMMIMLVIMMLMTVPVHPALRPSAANHRRSPILHYAPCGKAGNPRDEQFASKCQDLFKEDPCPL